MSDQVNGLLSPWLRRRRFEAAIPYLQGRVLDFGCGTGELCDAIVQSARKESLNGYVGVDRDQSSLDMARGRHAEAVFLDRLPEEGRFDSVAALAVLEHLPDAPAVLRALACLLAEGGRIVVTTPTRMADRIHAIGSRIGLFSAEAQEEHCRCLDDVSMAELAADAGLRMAVARRFLLGMNQLFVLEAEPR